MTGNKEKEKYYYTALEKIDKSTGPRRHSGYAVSFRL